MGVVTARGIFYVRSKKHGSSFSSAGGKWEAEMHGVDGQTEPTTLARLE
jgi:hypothetical protein